MRVWCVSSECIHNKSNLCNAKEINIKDGYVNTASNGQMHYQLCRMYKPNKEYQQIENNMKKWLRDKFLKENLDTEEKAEVDRMNDTTKDCFGNDVKVGDTVIFAIAYYKDLTLGKVIKISPKSAMVKYDYHNAPHTNRRYSYSFALWEKS